MGEDKKISIAKGSNIEFDQYGNVIHIKVDENTITINYDFETDIKELNIVYNKAIYKEVVNYSKNELLNYQDNIGNIWSIDDDTPFPYGTQREVLLFGLIEYHFLRSVNINRDEMFGFKVNKPIGPTKPIKK